MTFDEELEALAHSHASRMGWEKGRASVGKVRAELKLIVRAAQGLVTALSETTEQTRGSLAGTLTRRGVAGATFAQNGISVAGDIMDVALATARQLPRKWLPFARRLTTDGLRTVFERHGRTFTAWASDEHGRDSDAVTCLVRVAHRAGDKRLTAGAARKLIEESLR